MANSGSTPLVVAEGNRALGVIELKDVVKQGMRERFDELRRMGIRTVMITGDNPLTAAAIAKEAGVDDFLAEATPEDKMALIRTEQAGGHLVAMTGDGTNDAPALAQADVGVAMNTGTQAAKEAGNMVDLDSNPTKLIEIVEIGKQLLITRGSLTTFSIANDVAKYFAIIPAMFVGVFPALDRINVMDLQTPRSAILSAVIFNALVIVCLIPLALRGVKFRAESAAAVLRRNLLIYGVGGIITPFIGIKAHRRGHLGPGSEVMRRQLIPALRMVLVLTVLCGLLYPLAMTGVAQALFADKADGSLIERDGEVVGSSLVGQAFSAPEYFHTRPSAAGALASGSLVQDTDDDGNPVGDPYPPTRRPVAGGQRGLEPGADQPRPPGRHRGAHGGLPGGQRPRRRRAGADRRRHRVGLGRRPAHLRRQRPPPGPAGGRRARAVRRRGARARRRPHRRPVARVPRRGGRERAGAQPRPRCAELSGMGTRQPAHLPGGRAGRRQDLRHAQRGLAARRARHRHRRRATSRPTTGRAPPSRCATSR